MKARQTTDFQTDHHEAEPNVESIFRLHYGRVVRLIARIIRDPSVAEEMAVEVFLRWTPLNCTEDRAISGWLTKTSVRLALDEIRRRDRQERLAKLFARLGLQPSPEDLYASHGQREKVIQTLAKLKRRDAELLTLRSEGMTYEEVASLLSIKPASIGKLISRAQLAFRKEYLKRHGTTD